MTTNNGNANGTAAIEPHTNGSSPDGYSTSGHVRAVSINSEMQTAYLDYAMSVIVSRALPDVRDGLKPVHRRILYAMYRDLGLTSDKPHRKSARIVGEVLGKYHPHGDSAVYDAMVRMAQEFSLRYPLVDGQGNFGSIDGDNAAAMRYTEARLAPISNLMLEDLEKDTVDWHENFDNSLLEPDILPAALPNLLINGSSGIAVGMATNIPPHNLSEVVDALTYMIDHYDGLDDITVEQLMQFIKGPDFPTGGILYRYREAKKDEDDVDAIAQGYGVGRARLILQAKAHFEEMSRARKRIVITELPYQTNKTTLIERIASLVRDGKIEGVTDMRDESDRAGMRIVIELTRNVDPKRILELLFKYTPLQQTFGMQMLALVEDEPRTLSLKKMLHHFIQHRQEIIRRRSEFDLNRARERAHIVEGLLRALDILDEVIATIRRSQRVDTARNNLMKNFGFTQVQAQAILDMQLRRLAALERKKLQDEFKELQERIAYLEDLLEHPEKILAVINADLLKIKEEYGDARRTQIVERTKGTLTSTDLLPDQDVWVSVSDKGQLKRRDVTNISATTSRQSGKGADLALLTANTRDYLYLFHESGQCRRVAIHEIPGSGSGKHLAELTEFSRRDNITAALTLPRELVDMDGYLFMVTRGGLVKRVTLADFQAAAAADPQVFSVDIGDQLGWVLPTKGEQEIILVTNGGQSIRFQEEDVRSMGLTAGGVGGIKLKKGQHVVHAGVVDPRGELVTITTNGYAKRTSVAEYSTQGRNGQGVVTHKPSKRTGDVVAALLLPEAALLQSDQEWVIVVPNKGAVHPVLVSDIPQMGRSVQGNQIVTLDTDNQVVNLQRLTLPAAPPPPDSDDSDDPGESDGGEARAANGRGRKNASSSKKTSRKTPSNRKSRSSASGGSAKAKRGTTAQKSTSNKSTSKEPTPKKTTSRKSSSKKSTAEKSTAKRSTANGTQSRKTAPGTKTGAAPPGSGRTRAKTKKSTASAKTAGTKTDTTKTSTKKSSTKKGLAPKPASKKSTSSAKSTPSRTKRRPKKVATVASVTANQVPEKKRKESSESSDKKTSGKKTSGRKSASKKSASQK